MRRTKGGAGEGGGLYSDKLFGKKTERRFRHLRAGRKSEKGKKVGEKPSTCKGGGNGNLDLIISTERKDRETIEIRRSKRIQLEKAIDIDGGNQKIEASEGLRFGEESVRATF